MNLTNRTFTRQPDSYHRGWKVGTTRSSALEGTYYTTLGSKGRWYRIDLAGGKMCETWTPPVVYPVFRKPDLPRCKVPILGLS